MTDTAPRPQGPLGSRRRRGLALIAVLVAIAVVLAIVAALRWHRHSTASRPQVSIAPTDGPNGTLPVAQLGHAVFDVPTGFTAATKGLRPANPPYQPYGGRYLTLDSAPGQLQVLAVIIYHVGDAAVPTTEAGRLRFVASLSDRIHARLTTTGSSTTIADRPAVVQEGIQTAPSGRSPAEYRYRTWYVFAPRNSLVQVVCQWSTQRSTILTGCQQLVDSLTVS